MLPVGFVQWPNFGLFGNDKLLVKAITAAQFAQVPGMLAAFEHVLGPYPFRRDGYKLVQVPYAGMEHQSAVAYGNHFQNGYLGRDLSSSGWGNQWDFIIIHESGHEWFGNNVTTADLADMWVHEGFTNYLETLFTTREFGVEAGNDYVIGTRKLIRNNKTIIPPYGVNQEGSGDMYNKGAGLLHHIRETINNDSLFRDILIGLNQEFRHQTVDSRQVESYFIKRAGIDLQPLFDQYLRTNKVPVLEYNQSGQTLKLRLSNCNESLKVPIRVDGKKPIEILLTTQWQEFKVEENVSIKSISDNYYFNRKEVY